MLAAPPAHAQGTQGQSSSDSPTFRVEVIATTPLPGMGVTLDQIAAPVQSATAAALDESRALDVSDFLNRRFTSVHVNDIQGNPFQVDLNFRGYTASPLLGTPQGLSVFMDGVRLNQPFGDVVSWDLIPRIAIASSVLMPGSNPLFGLNTLGGSLSMQTKDGRSHRGTGVRASYGSDVRRDIEVEHGGAAASGLHWYVAGNLFGEDGWREDSPSVVRQIFGKVGWQLAMTELTLTAAHADNSLRGNGLQETGFLDRRFSSVYTKPDITDNRSTFLNASLQRTISSGVALSGNAYFRRIRTNTLNGDINEASLDQAVYQPTAAERAALAAAGYPDVPTSGASAATMPFPFLRCLGNVLLGDEPAEKCNGLINRSRTRQHNVGLSGQATHKDRRNQLTVGAAFDRSSAAFVQSSELGYLAPDRSVTRTGAFADGVGGGFVDGEPFDTRVDLDGRTNTASIYATDTLAVADAWHVTISGRFNRTTVDNRDRIEPGGGSGSLDGRHTFSRLNRAAGVTFQASPSVNVYAGYSEGSRAATSIELGCANPDQPCKLPNAMAGDPPLDQVVTRTLEAGARGRAGWLDWTAGVFRAVNHDDLLFLASEQTGFGYFGNVEKTRRQGMEIGVNGAIGRISFGGGYTRLDATFQSSYTLDGSSNSSNDAAESGAPGLEGNIEVGPGDRIPLIPRHALKAFVEVRAMPTLSVGFDLIAVSESFVRGNENNRHDADGIYYRGAGAAPGYAIAGFDASYRVTPRIYVVAVVTNLFNRRYFTAGQLGANGFTDAETFIARPLPPIAGEFPLVQGTFYAPGAPRRFSIGTRLRF
jgi:outer membrane receptor protein involved in Fe transport